MSTQLEDPGLHVQAESNGHRSLPPMKPGALRWNDFAIFFGAAASSLSLVWLVYERLAPTAGALGFLICWVATFLLVYWIVIREVDGPLVATDKLVAVGIGIIAVGLLVPLVSILVYIIYQGLHALTVHFFLKDMTGIAPDAPATTGGASHAIVGSLEQVGIALIISVPIGITAAVYMNEVRGQMTRPVRTFVNAMSGVPSIVAGLFIYATWLLTFHHSFSGFAAALALSILMLPTVARTSEEVLRLVPDGLREASLALGSPEWRTTWSVVLPTARSGLVTAVILGMARAVGETAPLIMTSFGTQTMNANPFSGAQQSLPLFVWQQYQLGGGAVGTPSFLRAFTGAFALIMVVLVLFVIARLIGRSKFTAR